MADTFTLDALITPVTRQEAQAAIYEVLGVLGVNTTSWKPGAVLRTLIVGASVVLASLSELQAKIARSGFLEFSEDSWLTLVGRHVYGVERITSTFATGEITLTNSGGGVYSFDSDDLIFANSATGRTFRNTEAVSLGALAAATVAIAATEAGADSSSGPGEIGTLVTTVLGVTCTNDAQLTGTDAESDASLRSRCQEKLGSLSPFGVWDAYSFAIRSATHTDGSSIGVTRVRIVRDGYGTVTTYLAGPSGAIPGDVDDPTTDLGIANAAIQMRAAPVGVDAVVVSATDRVIGVTYELWMYESALTDEQVAQRVEAAIVGFMRAQPIGGNVIASPPGKVFVSALQAAIFDSLTESFRVDVSLPAADVELGPEQVAIAGAPVATAIHRSPRPGGFGGSIRV
jgi:uncharacterized phage protein gp47/JayE